MPAFIPILLKAKKLWPIIKPILPYVVIGVLGILLFRQCSVTRKVSAEKDRVETNYNELDRKASEQTKQFNLTEAELQRKIADSEQLSKIVDSLKIKAKDIQRVQVYKSERVIHDTLVDIDTVFMDNGLNYYTTTKEGCNFKVTTGWFDGDSHADVKAEITTELTFINYYKRRKLFGWGFTPKWGKKEFHSLAIDACAGDTILNNAVFEKVK